MHVSNAQPIHARIPTLEGQFQLHYYGNNGHCSASHDGKEHLALVYGEVKGESDVLVRVHSECFTGDVLGSLRCDCGPQLQKAMLMIAQAGQGVILYLRQEGRGIGLAEKLKAYNLQDQGYDTVEANLMLGHQADEREYEPAAAILSDLGISSIQLLTNNPEKIEGLTALGITVNQRVALETSIHAENSAYLHTKVERMRHMLSTTTGHLSIPTTDAPVVETTQVLADDTRSLDNTVERASTGNGSNSITSAPASPPLPAGSTGYENIDEQLHVLHQRIAQHNNSDRPFVTLSYAQSLDGSISARRGQPLAISGDESMKVTHAIRAIHDSILVGINTVLADDPQLNVRLVAGDSPTPVVLDSRLRIPRTARLFSAHSQVIIGTTQTDCSHHQPEMGVDNLALPEISQEALVAHLPHDQNNQVSLHHLLCYLKEQGIRSVMVEGGSSVLTSFLRSQLVDYVAVTVAPIFVGGLNVIESNASSLLEQPVGADAPAHTRLPRLSNPAWTPIGSDLILWGEPCAAA